MSGATIPEILRQRVRASAKDRCGYCLSPQRLVLGWLEIEHIVPKSRGGTDDEQNLWLACRLCNNWKSNQTEALDPESNQTARLFDPRQQQWSEHFAWSDDGTHILGRTPCGRATIIALQLNNLIAVTVGR
jgi:5-methylcytosine-specific restriction endonuclease McrA